MTKTTNVVTIQKRLITMFGKMKCCKCEKELKVGEKVLTKKRHRRRIRSQVGPITKYFCLSCAEYYRVM